MATVIAENVFFLLFIPSPRSTRASAEVAAVFGATNRQ